MKRLLQSLLLIFISTSLFSQRNMDAVVVTAEKITDQLYMLQGAGGNIGVFIGDDGVLMIDSQFAPLSDKIKEAIQKLSDHPVKYLVNTHFHGDHTGGNANFVKEGATVIAQHNVRKRLSQDNVRPFGGTTAAVEPEKWPSISFGEDLQLHINGESLQLFHVHNAHTDGDSFVYFPNANVLHMGDCFFKDRFPYIDIDMGGSVKGAIAAIEAALMIVDEETVIIPGHGSLASKEDLRRYLAMINTTNDRVKNVATEESNVDNMDVDGLVEGYADWGQGFINAKKWVGTLLRSME